MYDVKSLIMSIKERYIPKCIEDVRCRMQLKKNNDSKTSGNAMQGGGKL